MPRYERVIELNQDITKEEAKMRLKFLFTEYVLPRTYEERQKIYTEIAYLLEKVQ
tara:strand:- start:714 stop:878 length:165 start_codon:yes stop_codon:yes gene_type:complete